MPKSSQNRIDRESAVRGWKPSDLVCCLEVSEYLSSAMDLARISSIPVHIISHLVLGNCKDRGNGVTESWQESQLLKLYCFLFLGLLSWVHPSMGVQPGDIESSKQRIVPSLCYCRLYMNIFANFCFDPRRIITITRQEIWNITRVRWFLLKTKLLKNWNSSQVVIPT